MPQPLTLALRNKLWRKLISTDLDLRKDDEHLTVTGKGSKQRKLLLDDPALLREMSKPRLIAAAQQYVRQNISRIPQ